MKNKAHNRRDFIRRSMRVSLGVTIGGIGGLALKNGTRKE